MLFKEKKKYLDLHVQVEVNKWVELSSQGILVSFLRVDSLAL